MAEYIKKEDATPYLTKYIPSVEAVERSKIDKAIEEIKAESYSEHIDGADCDDILIIELEDVLEILRRNIGE